jgi:hypothetical protein
MEHRFDSDPVLRAIRLAERFINEAEKFLTQRGPLIKKAAGALRYLEGKLQREGGLKYFTIDLLALAHKIEEVGDTGVSEREFIERSRKLLEGLGLAREVVQGKI